MSGKRGTSSTSKCPTALSYPQSRSLPLVVTLNCIEHVSLESDYLSGVAVVEHVSLSRLAEARIKSAAAILLHSLAFLPRAAQCLLCPWQLILCLGSSDRSVNFALAANLGLNRLVHVDISRTEEVVNTVMTYSLACFVGLTCCPAMPCRLLVGLALSSRFVVGCTDTAPLYWGSLIDLFRSGLYLVEACLQDKRVIL